MPDPQLGELLYPRHCRVGVSPDKKQLAFTYTAETHTPVTIVLPIEGAVGLQRQLAQCLYLLGVRPIAPQAKSQTEPTPTVSLPGDAATAPDTTMAQVADAPAPAAGGPTS
jgi:hypothetical protein